MELQCNTFSLPISILEYYMLHVTWYQLLWFGVSGTNDGSQWRCPWCLELEYVQYST